MLTTTRRRTGSFPKEFKRRSRSSTTSSRIYDKKQDTITEEDSNISTVQSSSSSTDPDSSSQRKKHYPSEGKMFDIEKGPDHHLIEVDHKDIENLGDKSVNVHEMKLDAVDITVASFAFLAFVLFYVAFFVRG